MITLLSPPIEESPYCWLAQSGRGKLGVKKDNGWCIQLGGRVIFFNSEERCVPLVQMLEMEEQEFSTFLDDAISLKPDYAEAIRKFPKLLLLKHVFNSSFSGYWPERALEWISSDQQTQSLLNIELDKFSRNRVMPQRARQIAKRMTKQRGRPQNSSN
jgi:hypothetical protein